MITEDYVSFEIAKLLKEKGFDAECDYLYADGKLVRAQGYACNWNDGETLFADYKNECSAPTLQMTMKWLREHNIALNVCYFLGMWYYSMYRTDVNSSGFTSKDFDTYEQACEAGIKYCLENLI